ncbi:MAG: NUDIX domain-containing protein [Filimonas sp.]|nr:NUDIX domain-containing protein [Filimonas sp.]
MLQTAGLIVVRNRQLLLAFSNNKRAWYLPGGKVDAGETAVQALIREIEEELNIILAEKDLTFYYHISAPAFGESGLQMEQDCFLYDLKAEPKASKEIGGLQYFDEATYRKEEHIVPGVITAFEKLRVDGLVD